MNKDVNEFSELIGADYDKALTEFHNFVRHRGIVEKHKHHDFIHGDRRLGSLFYIALIGNSELEIQSVLEIGTLEGRAALTMSYFLPEAKILTIDYIENSKRRAEVNNLEMVLMNSLDLWEKYPNTYFDFIFVDGDHMDPAVSSDVKYAVEHINDDGIILFDDYGHGDVKPAVDSIDIKDSCITGTMPWSITRKETIAYLIKK